MRRVMGKAEKVVGGTWGGEGSRPLVPAEALVTKRQCARAALLTVAVLCVAVLPAEFRLPFDREYNAVIYLMWSGNWAWAPVVVLVRYGLMLACILVPLILITRVLWPAGREPEGGRRVWNASYRYALLLPLAYALATVFSRYVANLVYLGAGSVSWDFTPYVARLESPIIEALQRAADSPRARAIFSWFYSV